MPLSAQCKVCERWVEISKEYPQHIKIGNDIYHAECAQNLNVKLSYLNDFQRKQIAANMQGLRNIAHLYSTQIRKLSHHCTEPVFKNILHKLQDQWQCVEDFKNILDNWTNYLDKP